MTASEPKTAAENISALRTIETRCERSDRGCEQRKRVANNANALRSNQITLRWTRSRCEWHKNRCDGPKTARGRRKNAANDAKRLLADFFALVSNANALQTLQTQSLRTYRSAKIYKRTANALIAVQIDANRLQTDSPQCKTTQRTANALVAVQKVSRYARRLL